VNGASGEASAGEEDKCQHMSMLTSGCCDSNSTCQQQLSAFADTCHDDDTVTTVVQDPSRVTIAVSDIQRPSSEGEMPKQFRNKFVRDRGTKPKYLADLGSDCSQWSLPPESTV